MFRIQTDSDAVEKEKNPLSQDIEEDIYWDSRFSIQFLEVWLGSHALAMENPIKDPYVSLCHDVLMRCFCLNVDETKNKTGKIYVSEEDHW